MVYLETTSQLDNYTKKGLINIAKNNREIFIAYNRIGKEDLYDYIVKMFQDGAKIKIPLLEDDEIIKCNNCKTSFCNSCNIKLYFRTDRTRKKNTIKNSKYCNKCITEFDIFHLC
jgi:hypothetical protein